MARACALIGLLWAARILTGCVELDVSRPIYLVPGEGMSTAEVKQVLDSAISWNLELGTSLEVTRDPAGAPQVPIFYSDFICAYASGVTELMAEIRVQLCSLQRGHARHNKEVILHELGHVLGIPGHAEDTQAIMAAGGIWGVGAFRQEDRRMFAEAHPGFVGRQGDGRVNLLAASTRRPVMAHPPGHPPYLFWSEAGSLRFSALDLASGQLSGAAGRVAVSGTPTWIRAVPAAEGIQVSFVLGKTLRLVTLALPSAKAGSVVTAQLDISSLTTLEHVSSVALGRDLFLLFSEVYPDGLTLRRLDRATGAARTLQRSAWSGAGAELVSVGSTLVLVTRRKNISGSLDGVVALQLSLAGEVLDKLVLPATGYAENELLAVAAGAGRIYIFDTVGRATLRRLAVSGAGLSLERTTQLTIPTELPWRSLPTLAQDAGVLALALSSGSTSTDTEVQVQLLDAATLLPKGPFQRMSSPDLMPSMHPWVSLRSGAGVVIWREMYDSQAAEIKSRRFAY